MKTTTLFSAKIKVALLALGTVLGSGNLLASSGPAAGVLTGTLQEKCTKAPLGYVRVALVQPSTHAVVASTRTLADGSFCLSNMPAGTYQLRTDLLGYEPLGQVVRFGRAGWRLGTVAVAPVAEQQVLVRPGFDEPMAQVSRGVAVGRW